MKIFYQYNLKILAVISAIILWFIVITVENTVTKYPDPIQVKAVDLSEHYALSSPLPEATLYLKMDATELKTISTSDIELFIDLSEIAEGTHTVKISATVDGSRSQVLKVEPAEITVTLSAVLKKQVPLKLQLTGEPHPDFLIKQTLITPDTVTINGAKQVLDQIEQIDLPYKFSGTETVSFEQDITIDLQNITDQPLIATDPEIVTLQVELESKNAQKEVKIVPTFTREEDQNSIGSKLIIEPQTINIQGAGDTIKAINEISTAPIEVSALLRNKTIETKLTLPAGVSLVDPTQKITLTIQ